VTYRLIRIDLDNTSGRLPVVFDMERELFGSFGGANKQAWLMAR